jgi:hypothetical protein
MSRLDDGFPTTIEFAGAPGIKLYEKTVKPPGFDGGGPNDTTTMRNINYRTKAPKKLLTVTPSTAKCAYDPTVYNTLRTQMQINQQITYTFPNGQTCVAWGWIDKVEFDEITEGKQPEATVTIEPSNQDATGTETILTVTGT